MSISIVNAAIQVTDAGGAQYAHDYVTNINIVNPRENGLALSPQSGRGIRFDVNITQPVTVDMVVRGMAPELLALYTQAFEEGERLDLSIVDAKTGEHYYINEALVKSDPRNATIADGETSLDQPLSFIAPQNAYSYGAA